MADHPSDIHPESRNRLRTVTREELDETGKAIYDEVTTPSPTSLVGLQGPGGIFMHNTRIAEPRRHYTRAVRTDPHLGKILSELVILVTAREMNQQFEWTVHELQARKMGLDERLIEIVKRRLPLEGIGEKEAAIIQLGREAIGKPKVSSETYARAQRLFGDREMVAIASLMGSYASTAIALTIFDQQLPPGVAPALPLP